MTNLPTCQREWGIQCSLLRKLVAMRGNRQDEWLSAPFAPSLSEAMCTMALATPFCVMFPSMIFKQTVGDIYKVAQAP